MQTEIVMDGGAFLNWRTDEDVEALVLVPSPSEGEDVLNPRRAVPGPHHGVVDLRDLQAPSYRLRLRTASGTRPLSLREHGQVLATHNEGWVGDDRWVLHEDGRGVLLCRQTLEERAPGVTTLNCALGIVTITAGPMLEDDWSLELRRRGSEQLISATSIHPTQAGQEFRLGAKEWDAMRLPPDDEITRWDVWAVRTSSPDACVRLRWNGSSAADPRVSQRLRATVARPHPGSTTRVRPYWTLDQHLSIEISRSKDAEGIQP